MEAAYLIAGGIGLLIFWLGLSKKNVTALVIGAVVIFSVLVALQPALPEATVVLVVDIAKAFGKFFKTVF